MTEGEYICNTVEFELIFVGTVSCSQRRRDFLVPKRWKKHAQIHSKGTGYMIKLKGIQPIHERCLGFFTVRIGV